MKLFQLIIIQILLICGLASGAVTIKIATIAPEGSSWMDIMHEMERKIVAATGGEVTFKWYAGGVAGDELDVIRKMRIGQIHAAGLTGFGMGDILHEFRIMDSPRLFKTEAEVAAVYAKLEERFKKGFEEKGYVFLGSSEVGFVYAFANKRFSNMEEYRKLKFWVWGNDPFAVMLGHALDLNSVNLAITDVLTSLQTGLIDGFYMTTLGSIALQWFSRVKFVVDEPIANSFGGVVITKDQYNKIPPAHRREFESIFRQYLAKIDERTVVENGLAFQTLAKNNVQLLKLSPAIVQFMDERSASVWTNQIGKAYSAQILATVQATLKDFRAGNQAAIGKDKAANKSNPKKQS